MKLPACLAAACAVALLAGCGALARSGWKAGDPVPTRRPTAATVEGLVADRTLRPYPDAEIELRTERPGYVVRARSGAGGRFTIAYSTLLAEGTSATAIWGGNDDRYVSWVELRAWAGGLCTFPVRRRPEELAERPVVLELGPCPVEPGK